MKGKRSPEKLARIVNNLKDSAEKVKIRQIRAVTGFAAQISQLAKLESEYITLLKKAKKILKSKSFAGYHGEVAGLNSVLDEDLLEIRKKYISKISSTYKYSIEESVVLNLPEYQNLKYTIRDLIFKKIVGDIIPEHPKDEYKNAREIKRHFTIHCGDTNTGKTYNALEALKSAGTGVYLAPLRLLALQVFQTLNEDGILCTLSTGEEDIFTPGANHISSTVEKLDLDKEYELAVIDEAQMIADKQRGSAWTKALLGVLAPQVHICCSPNAVNLLIQLISDCGDTYEVREYVRDTPLVMDEADFSFPQDVKGGDALIVFSKKAVLSVSGALSEYGGNASVIYGDLPPETRRKQMRRFADGETDIIVTTDAIGMGLNLPIKRIVFMETKKFDGENLRDLTVGEIKQISGRAGRKNIYDVGYVNGINGKKRISEALGKPLPDLDKAYYIPLEKYVLSLPMGTLEERLLCCMDARDGIDYIYKADIEQPLKLLHIIEKEKFPLDLGEMCRLIFIPFDENNGFLVRQWHGYIKAYVENGSFFEPVLRSESLEELELYYKSLDLHYSFCKTMGITFDKENIMRLKYKTSEKIHETLKTKIKMMHRKCRRCGAKLEWNFRYNICDSCYIKMDAFF